MIFIFVSGFLSVFLMWLIPVQTVAAVTALMAVNACLAAGFSGFTWYSHFIFLSYLGGLLVLFLYSTALAPCPVKLTRVRPGFTWIHVKLYFVFVAVYWVLASGASWESFYSPVIKNEMVGTYDDHSWFENPEMMGFSWLGSWFLPALGLILFLCMVCVTKFCAKVSVSLRRVVTGVEPPVLKKKKKETVPKKRETSLNRLTYWYVTMDDKQKTVSYRNPYPRRYR